MAQRSAELETGSLAETAANRVHFESPFDSKQYLKTPNRHIAAEADNVRSKPRAELTQAHAHYSNFQRSCGQELLPAREEFYPRSKILSV